MLGADSIDDLASGEVPQGLEKAEDVTSSLLIPRQERAAGPHLDTAKVALPRAGVASFQCWMARCPNMVAVLLGSHQKRTGRMSCASIVAGRDWKHLLEDPRVARACDEEEALLCGAMVGEQVRDEPGGGKQFLMDLREKGFHTAICAYVA